MINIKSNGTRGKFKASFLCQLSLATVLVRHQTKDEGQVRQNDNRELKTGRKVQRCQFAGPDPVDFAVDFVTLSISLATALVRHQTKDEGRFRNPFEMFTVNTAAVVA